MDYQIGFNLESLQLLTSQTPWIAVAVLILVGAWLYQSTTIFIKYSDQLVKQRHNKTQPPFAQLPREICFVLFTFCSLSLLATSVLYSARQQLPHLPSLVASGAAFTWFLLYLSVFQRAARKHAFGFITMAIAWGISVWVQAVHPPFATLCLATQSLVLMGATLVTWTTTQSVKRHILNGNLAVCMGLIFMAVALMLPQQNISAYLSTDLQLASACFLLAAVFHIYYQYTTRKNLALGLDASHQVIQRMMLDFQHLVAQHTPINNTSNSSDLDTKTGEQPINLQPIDVHKLVEHAFNTFKSQAIQKGLTFNINRSEAQFPEVLADAEQLTYIVHELIANAITFTNRGSIHVQLLHKSGKQGDALFKFCVQDTGIGVTPEQQDNLFNTSDDKSQSQGTGLRTCSNLLKQMGGALRFTSIPDTGTKVTAQFKCPIAPTPALAIYTDSIDAQAIDPHQIDAENIGANNPSATESSQQQNSSA